MVSSESIPYFSNEFEKLNDAPMACKVLVAGAGAKTSADNGILFAKIKNKQMLKRLTMII